jgi:hypothetical protein
MNKPTDYGHLNFQRQPWKIPGRVLATVGVVILLSLLWWILPPVVLYWLLLFPVVGLTWAATYGFREALKDVIKLLQRLANF